MRDPLVLAIREAVKPDGPIYKSAVERHKDKPLNLMTLNVQQELSAHIAPEVMNEPTLRDARNLMIRIGDAGGAMSFSHQAVHLVLMWTNQLGPTKAVRRLRKLLALKEAIGYHVEALAGLEIKGPTRLPNDVQLLPFEQLPNSLQKNRLISRRFDYLEFGLLRGPAVALRLKTKVRPLFYDHGSNPEIQDFGHHREILNATRLCLELVGPRALVRLNGWFQYTDEMLDIASGAGGMSYPSAPYQANVNIPTPQEFNPAAARKITSEYFGLTKGMREIVTRAMERLHKAMCDPLPGDAAIDLSIAFETLTTDPGGQGEHTWKVGLRSALLLGGNLEKRETTRRTVKKIYDFRSKVVHQGHIPNDRVTGAISAVKDGTAICAQIIERTIRRGRLPSDWSKFELSGGKAY